MARQWRIHGFGSLAVISCNVIAEGQFANQPANDGGMPGAPWVLCDEEY